MIDPLACNSVKPHSLCSYRGDKTFSTDPKCWQQFLPTGNGGWNGWISILLELLVHSSNQVNTCSLPMVHPVCQKTAFWKYRIISNRRAPPIKEPPWFFNMTILDNFQTCITKLTFTIHIISKYIKILLVANQRTLKGELVVHFSPYLSVSKMAAIGKDGHDITHSTQGYRGMQLYMHVHRE